MSPQELLAKLYARTCRMQDACFEAAGRYQRLYQITGYPGAILSSLTAVPVFATFFDSSIEWLKILAIVTALLGGAGSATTIFFDFKQRFQSYQKSGAAYASLKREIELLLTFPTSDLEAALKEMTQRWDTMTAESPVIPDSIWNKYANKTYSITNGTTE